MAKRNKLLNVYLMIVNTIVAVGIGTLFIDGAFATTMLLGWIPALGHTIIGWTVVGSAILGMIMSLIK